MGMKTIKQSLDVNDTGIKNSKNNHKISLFGNCLKIYELYLNNTAQVGQ